ncbi:hypothetical protein ACVBEJ_13870 [Porticoccus sp. GXU_MW_L64]
MTQHAAIPYAEHLPEADRQRIQQILATNPTDDQLYEILGKSMGEAATGRSLIKAAKKAFARRKADITRIVCRDKKIRSFVEDPKKATAIELSMMVAGKLVDDGFEGIDYVAMAVLATQLGLMMLCDAEWKD